MMDHFKFCADNFLQNLDELNRENGTKAINIKPLMRCLGIDSISKVTTTDRRAPIWVLAFQ